MQSQSNYGSFLSKSDLHVMIKNTMLARNCPKGKGPILTMAMQMAGEGVFEQWPFSVGEMGSEFEKQFQLVIILAVRIQYFC